MSGASVVVLALNGRRQTVKCSPNTTILQIIEEVCKKQGLNPHEFDIKHHNKILDTTTSFRFSGLPNNAQLELAPAVKNRQEGNVTLAVNLEDGTRITDTFSPNDTLMNILNKICPQNAHPDRNPVVIYTRREIYGKELENCTLRSLGLVGGRAMIRVLNRDPELLKQQANVSAPLPTKPVEEKPYVRKFQPVEVEESKAQTVEAQPHDYGVGHKMTGSEESGEVKPQKNLKNPGAVDYVRLAKEKRKSLDTPKSPDLQREKKKMTENLPTHSEIMDVEETTDNPTFEDDFVFCGERNGMIFSQESAQSVPTEDLPDDFFELTIDDAKRILRDVKQKRQELENQVLRTSQLRQLEESKKQLRQLNRYKRAVIRVQFPDRTVVQGTFKPTETIQDVIEFIKSYLEDQSIDFYIYSTPPKEILDKTSRLIEVGCVPGALLYFGLNTDLKQESYLKKELRDKFTTNSVASLAAAKIRHENTRLVEDNEEDDVLIERVNDNVPVNYGASTSSDSSSTERKIVSNSADFPKWFKPL